MFYILHISVEKIIMIVLLVKEICDVLLEIWMGLGPTSMKISLIGRGLGKRDVVLNFR